MSHDLANDGQIQGSAGDLQMTPDGQSIVFVSDDPNLAVNGVAGEDNVYRWSAATKQVELVSVNAAGTGPGDGASILDTTQSVSADGNMIVFTSGSDDIVPGTSGHNVFVRDMTDGTTTLVSSSQAGVYGGSEGSITADGSLVAFVGQDAIVGTVYGNDVFVQNLATQTTTLVTRRSERKPSRNELVLLRD